MLCCNLHPTQAKFDGWMWAVQMPATVFLLMLQVEGLCSTSQNACKCSPCRMPAPDFQIQAKHRYFRLCFASSCGAVLLGVEHPFPQKHSEATPGVRWQHWVGWEPLITPLHVPACCFPLLTLFHLRQQEKLFMLAVSPPHLSFPNLSQGHHRQGSG